MKSLISIAAYTLASLWLQAAHANTSELTFPIEKSNIRILPQRFEYHLLDANRFEVGNMLIQATDIGVRLLSSKNQKFIFFWPLNLLDSGEVVIKDSSGKAIWSRQVSKSQVQIKKSRTGTSLATTELEAADNEELLKIIQHSPFFRFCAHRENSRTKVFFCSKDVYLNKKNGAISLQTRDSMRPDSFVEINGKLVEKQGFIFLNSTTDPLSLRALMLSGSTIEIDTHKKDVDFYDFFLSADEKKLMVALRTEDSSAGEAEAREESLDVERPSLYLKGEGNIPLKQEFLIEGPVRKKNIQVSVNSSPPSIVHSSSLAIDIAVNGPLKLEPADNLSTLEKQDNGQYRWTLKNLRRNEMNRRYVKVVDSDKGSTEAFWAAYDVKRLSSFELSGHVFYPLRGDLGLLWFPFEHWQLSGRYEAQLGKTSKMDSSSLISAQLFYRTSTGTYMIDPTYRAGIFYDSFQSSSGNLAIYGIVGSTYLKDLNIWGLSLPWTLFEAKAPLASSNSNYQIGGSFEAQTAVRLPQNLDRFHEFGLRYRSFNFRNTAGDISLQEGSLFYGYGIIF